MMKQFPLAVAASSLLAAATLSIGSDVDAAISEAAAAIEKAEAVGFAWRDSKKILDGAKKASAKGDTERALELAGQAKRQGEAAYAQYEASKNAGPHFQTP